MAALGTAVWRAVRPAKMNYAMLGNTEAHLHRHVHSRYADEPEPYRWGPISSYPKELRDDPRHRFILERDAPLITRVCAELESARSPSDRRTGARFCIHCGTGKTIEALVRAAGVEQGPDALQGV